MQSIPQLITQRLADVTGVDPELRPATKREFGHFQSNVALRLGKTEGRPPREVAQRIVDAVRIDDLCAPLEIAGPGFINIRLRPETLAAAATAVLADDRLGIPAAAQPQRVVVDYSSPNVAKQMHVGHLRSTIIGDCFNRILTAMGHTVIPNNHVGDWGRQFGMLIEQSIDEGLDLATLQLPDLDGLYTRANRHLKEDEAFAQRARDRVVRLQGGDPETTALWRQIVTTSLVGFDATYARMNVLLTPQDYVGESFYNDDLPTVAADLEQRGVAVVDDGALVVFCEGFAAPLIVRNSRGGFGYGCTDLAAIRHRVGELAADRIIYVTGQEQINHFALVFAAARKAGYLPADVVTQHVPYGLVLGADGKKFSTREGTAVPLTYLLDEAEKVASHDVALAAIKYADLSNQLIKDYSFNLERMSATTGDTGPYLQYAHARCCRVAAQPGAAGVATHTVGALTAPEEEELALRLSAFGEVVTEVADSLQPHKLCMYLFELATAYSAFYENCPIVKAEGDVKATRLALNEATKRVLAKGLDLLGIPAPTSM